MIARNLKYDHCEDWLIYAKDADGNLWYVITEMWQQWLDLPDDASEEPDAIEKYMLPIAREKWDSLNWHLGELSEKTFNMMLNKLGDFIGDGGYWKSLSRVEQELFAEKYEQVFNIALEVVAK